MSDAYVSTAFFEGGPLVFLEAIASNLPIVSTKVGFTELFEGHRGINLVDPPIDLFEYNGPIWKLKSNEEFEDKFAHEMKRTWIERIKPGINKNIIEKMDKKNAYRSYSKFIDVHLSPKEN